MVAGVTEECSHKIDCIWKILELFDSCVFIVSSILDFRAYFDITVIMYLCSISRKLWDAEQLTFYIPIFIEIVYLC